MKTFTSFNHIKAIVRLASVVCMLFVGVGNTWGGKITLTQSALKLSGSYSSSATVTIDGVTFAHTDLMKNNDNIQAKASTGVLYNSTAMPGNITEIKVTHSGTARSTTVYYGTSSQPTTNETTFSGSKTISVSGSNKYFKITRGSNAAYWTSIEITYADAVAYTITATRNNDSYGTVEVSGTTITATPAAGYRVMAGNYGYTVTSGTATVVNNGDNTFTVTPSSDCTVRINFESKGCTDHGASSITGGALSDADHGPLHAYYDYSTSQILYTKSDLDLAAGKKGTIKSIYFEYSGAAAMAARTIKIYMANTDLSSLTTSNYVPYASFTQVYSGTFSCGSAGWYEITLDTPFDYNGAGQLAVMIDDNTNKYESSKYFKYHSATGKQIYKRQDDTDIDPASWTPASAIDYRPNTKFCIQEADMVKNTVNWYANGEIAHSQTDYPGVALTSIPTPSNEGIKEFVGWAITPIDGSTDIEPALVSPTTIPNGGANYYAVYAIAGDAIYKRVTDTEDFEEGKKVVIVSSGKMLGMNDGGTAYTANDAPTETSNQIDEQTSNNLWTLSKDGDYWVFANVKTPAKKVAIDITSGGALNASTQTYYKWALGENSYDANMFYLRLYGTSSLTTQALQYYSSYTRWQTYSGDYSSSSNFALKLYIEDVQYSSYSTTCEPCTVAPTVSAGSYSDVTSTTATINCAGISSLGTGDCGVSSYGFVVGPNTNPELSGEGVVQYEIGTSSPKLNNAFNQNLTSLTPNTTYYVRPYATNGFGTSYGTQATFTTLQRYTISYNNNGGTGSIASAYKDHGIDFTLSDGSGMSKTGYTLTNWLLGSASGDEYALSGTYSANGDATFYAQWTANSYIVVFNANGGSGSISDQDFTYGVAQTLSKCTLTPPLHKYFTGWNTEADGSGTPYSDQQSVSDLVSEVDGSITLYAQWKDHTYTNYRTSCCTQYQISKSDATNGTFEISKTAACEGTTVNIEATPATGYSFGSWTIAKEEGSVSPATATASTSFTMPGEDVTVSASFTAKTYTIILDKNDGAADGEATATYNSSTLGDITHVTRVGYTLLGYFTETTEGDKVINADGTLVANVSPYTDKEGNWIYDDEVVFAAQWKSSGTYLVNITSPSNGTISVLDAGDNVINDGDEVEEDALLTITVSANTGYELATITVNEEAFSLANDNPLTLTEDIIVAATFSPISYSITYNQNGGTGVSNSSYTIESESITLPTAPTISRTGYTFAGWYANSDLSTGGVQTTIAAGSTGAKEYWAKWDVNTYTLSFDANGGTGSMSAVADWAYNTTDALPANNFSLTDYRFLGWAISDERADAGTVDYADGADYTMGAGNATLYAVWKHQVYNDWVFSCAELTLTPKLVTVSTPIFITSTASQTVRSQDSILISGTGLTPSATLTFPDLPSQFSIKSRTNGDLTTTAEGTINAVAYIFYTPDGEATEDGLDNIDALNVKVPGAKPRQATLSDTKIQGRHLPENFIIAAKRAGQWYALPANMTETTTPAPIEITVDDNNNPSIVLGVSTNVLGLRGMDKTGTYTIANAGQYIKLGMTNNPTYGNYPLFGSTTSSIGKGGAATSVSGNIGKQYWWLMTQTNTTVENAAEAKYNVYSANNSTNHLRLKENAGNPIWGLYDSGIEELRLIPYLAENIEATITGWTQKDVEIELEEAIEGGNADGVTAQLNEVTADANTLNGSETSYKANFPSSIDFADKSGQQLTLVWKRSGSVVGGSIVTIPSIVAPSEEVSSWSDIAATASDIIVINKPITIDVPTAVAKEIVLNRDNDAAGQLTIAADQALVVTGKIQVEKDGVLRPTTAADLKVESSAAGNGTLIFENDGNAATVEMYSIGSTDGWKWQYIGVPFDGANAQATYYGAYLYKWNNGWTAVQKSDDLEMFAGYCISYPAANYTYVMDGALAPTTSKSISVAENTSMVVGNSWTAPIQITQLEEADFSGLLKNVYLYNTGNDEGHSASTTSSPTGDAIYAAGTYISVPIHSAEYTGVKVISSLQGFFVKDDHEVEGGGTLSLSYSKHVRPSGGNSVVNGAMHAPKRVADETDRPAVLKMKVSGSQYDDRLILLEREDFTSGYDAGWDGDKMGDVATSPRITTTREDGTADAVAALPDLEGTLINFRAASTDDQYTLYFDYETEDAEPLYLLDLTNNAYTRVETGSSYTFFTTDKADHKRFALTRYRAPQITTGVEDASEDNGQGKAVKFIENDKLYILRNGVLYDGTGKKVIDN